jgi:dihydrofolate reductase
MSGRAAIARPFDLLLGRKTCEIFAARWRLVGEDDPFGRTFSQVTKYVAAEIARLRQGDGPILLTQGSNVLLQTLLAPDLIDEFRLLTRPLVLGRRAGSAQADEAAELRG